MTAWKPASDWKFPESRLALASMFNGGCKSSQAAREWRNLCPAIAAVVGFKVKMAISPIER